MPDSRFIHECFYNSSDIPVYVHFHKAVEILFVKAGSIQIKINRKTYEGHAGSVFVIGSLEEHSIQHHSAGYERYYIIFDPLHLERILLDRTLISLLRNHPGDFCHHFDMRSQSREIETIFQRLLSENELSQPYRNPMTAGLLTELLVMLLRLRPLEEQTVSDPSREAVFAAQTYIEQHFREDFRIQDLAEQVLLSSCYLTHCFKKITGYSPKQYLMYTRLACAKDLLSHTQYSVQEVAHFSGFSDVNNFIRTFRIQAGCTPLQYRHTHHRF